MEASPQYVYTDMDSPLGELRLIATASGLAAVLWEGEDYQRAKMPDAQRNDQHPILLMAEQQLKEYFAKTRTVFELPLDIKGTDFQLRVWKALLEIPFGITKTYGALARSLGDLKAVRAVGGALNKNPVAIIVPCHRVIGASGQLVGFAGGLHNKSLLLELENNRRMPTLFDD